MGKENIRAGFISNLRVLILSLKGLFIFLASTIVGCGILPFDRVARFPALGNASEKDLILEVKYDGETPYITGLIVPRDIKRIEVSRKPILELIILDTLKDTLMVIRPSEVDLSYERVQNFNEVWVYDKKGFSIITFENKWWYSTYEENIKKGKNILKVPH